MIPTVQRVRVKIEGLREPADALQIAQMGADAIGMVFADSPRQVDTGEARAIVEALPPWVATVGVFVNADASAINETIKQTGIQYVQLHGDEESAIVSRVAAPCIKAFRIRDTGWLDEVQGWLDGVEDRSKLTAVLFDAYDSSARGGTGRQFNWQMVAEARAAGKLEELGPIILAGGLDSTSVREAIEQVKPWAVDVASGVESAPGVKDIEKIEEFIRAVRDVGQLRSELWL